MIKLENVSKTFISGKERIEALADISLEIKKGEIFGVIGYSGAGKSTLIRCVNLLEKPTKGRVFVNGAELTDLSARALRKQRRKIAMIFQGFNLLKTATVYENIAIPLQLLGLSKKEVERRTETYLSIVGLADKHNMYPAQLSGGQKQRVAIARALANEPDVLLSDEATSALDPETTEAILDLLLKINQEFGITILLITHEMFVIQKICDRVAVLEKGECKEEGKVLELFKNPLHSTTKKFVDSIFNEQLPSSFTSRLQDKGPIIHLTFVGEAAGDPSLAEVSKRFNVYPNVLSGNIVQLKNEPLGRLVVHLKGSSENTDQAIQYLLDQGIQVEGVMSSASGPVSTSG